MTDDERAEEAYGLCRVAGMAHLGALGWALLFAIVVFVFDADGPRVLLLAVAGGVAGATALKLFRDGLAARRAASQLLDDLGTPSP